MCAIHKRLFNYCILRIFVIPSHCDWLPNYHTTDMRTSHVNIYYIFIADFELGKKCPLDQILATGEFNDLNAFANSTRT